MWKVQTEGYSDGKGMLVGVVTPSKVLEASPDGEFISSGQNSKGVDSVALGRQGSFFHWGFAASPTYMTDEAKLVFVNALHYISQFRGQRAITKKQIYTSRDTLEDLYYTLSKDGFARWQELLGGIREARQEELSALRKKQADGGELSEQEQMMLKAPPMPEYTRLDLVSLPETLKSRFGESWDQYVDYYRENRPFLHSPDAKEGRGFHLDVDPDVKQLGIPNNDVKLLEHCVRLLGNNKEHQSEHALRVLKRYTQEDFTEADQWQHWLNTYRDYLYFSDVSGFKFLVNVNALPESLRSRASHQVLNESDFKSLVEAIKVPKSDGSPVQFKCVLRNVATSSGPRVRLVIKSKIQKGWHLYAYVPKSAPYIQTRVATSELSNLKAVGKWQQAVGHPSRDDPSVLIWEDEVVMWRDFEFSKENQDVRLKLDVRYQACDASRCLPPKIVTFVLKR